MYKSPIEVFQTGIEYQLENDIMNMIQKYGITVDKDELLKALQYDRDQYDKGYSDGKIAAIDALVKCKDCKHYCPLNNGYCTHGTDLMVLDENQFCSYAERKETDELY